MGNISLGTLPQSKKWRDAQPTLALDVPLSGPSPKQTFDVRWEWSTLIVRFWFQQIPVCCPTIDESQSAFSTSLTLFFEFRGGLEMSAWFENQRFGLTAISIVAFATSAFLANATQVVAGPLHEAVRNGDAELVTELIEEGADVNEYGAPGGPPLHWASSRGYADVVAILLSHGADPNMMKNSMDVNSPLRLASEFGHLDVAKLLLDAGADPNIGLEEHKMLPLHKAAETNHPDILALLLERGAKLEPKAGSHLYTPLHQAAHSESIEAIEALVASGADVNIADGDGSTPMHIAITLNKIRSVEKLVGLGADLTRVDSMGFTPLGLALENGHEEIAGILRAAGAQ